jgi:hypothetical protein
MKSALERRTETSEKRGAFAFVACFFRQRAEAVLLNKLSRH